MLNLGPLLITKDIMPKVITSIEKIFAKFDFPIKSMFVFFIILMIKYLVW